MSVPIGWPDKFDAEALDGTEGVAVIQEGYRVTVATTGDIGEQPSSMGPHVLTVDTGTSTTTAYVATALLGEAEGRCYFFRPNATNTGVATLAINGGTARSLRTETGTQLTSGLLRSDTEYLIRYDGTVFRILGMRLSPRFQSRINLVGTTATLDGQAAGAEGTIVSRIADMASGNVILQVDNGAGGLQTALLAYGATSAASASKTTGTVLISGDLQVAGDMIGNVTFSGAPIFESSVNLNHRVNFNGSTATLDGYDTSGGTVMSRLTGFSSGSVIAQVTDGAAGLDTALYIYGEGNAAGRPAMEVRAFGGVRVEGNLHVVGTITSSSTATEENPDNGDAIIQLMKEFGGVAAYETLAEARTVTSTDPFQISPSDDGRTIWCNVSGAFIDVGDMLPHRTQTLNIGTAGTVTIWTGEPGEDWTDRTSEQVHVSKGRYRVHRGQGNEWEIEAVNGKTITDASTGTYPLPVYARSWPCVGYSNMIRVMQNVAGARDQFLAWGEDPSIINMISGVGASAMLKGGESNYPNNHWWNWQTSTPGPNITTFLAAVAAQPSTPAPEFCFVHIGYADMNLWDAADNPLSTALTEAQQVGHWHDCLEYIRGASGLNIPTLKFIIMPMAHRHIAVWDRKYWYATRRMQLQLCADHPDLAVRGPDSFDVRYIPNDSHPTIESQYLISARMARWSETIAERKSAFLGPEVSSVVQDSDTSTRIIIDPGLNDTYADDAGEALRFPGQSGDWTSAPLPPGIALLPPGSDYITDEPIEITNVRWSYSGSTKLYTLTLTHEAQANVRFCWPYGFMNECGQDPALCIRSLTSGEPLATYHPDVPLPKNLP